MRTFIAVGTCTALGQASAHDTLEKAQKTPLANLVVETDNQFIPYKIIRAWAFVANHDYNIAPEWVQLNVQEAAYRLANMILAQAIQAQRRPVSINEISSQNA